jgi:hypothetical protein
LSSAKSTRTIFVVHGGRLYALDIGEYMERNVKRAEREKAYTFTTNPTTVSGGNRWLIYVDCATPATSKYTDNTAAIEQLVLDWSLIDTWP